MSQKHHIIYRTTCSITGRFYVGMHSTNDLADGYLGSGLILRHSVEKYGSENHTQIILAVAPDRASLAALERQHVTEELMADPKCMNLKVGGDGGWDHVPVEAKQKGGIAANRIRTLRAVERYKDPEALRAAIKKREATNLERYGKKSKGNNLELHSNETKRKIGATQKARETSGSKNSQFGSCWITNGNTSIKVPKEETGTYLLTGWRKGRIMRTK